MNVWAISRRKTAEGLYRVEAKRLADDIRDTGSFDLSEYPHLTGVYSSADGELYSSDEHYLIINVNGECYRVEYILDNDNTLLIAADAVLILSLLVMTGMMIYIRRQIITPFGRLNEVPHELAKGNLAVEIPEEKSRFFGKFTWGVNMLRDTIEQDRRNEISIQREKKLLLLSLSHDIKTPLSAIKLNAKALAKGLYKDEEKRRCAAESINTRADEIESFVSQITKAASEDFMNFEVVPGEAFLSEMIGKITARYSPQLAMSGTELRINKYDDCILSCDPDRLAECLQNLVENAIKYGDGKLIELAFEKMDGCELITVSNTGCTLETSELTQIFESFHRGGNTGNRPGNGLGLFICRKLMGLMDGEVFADIRDGCFCITLVVKMA
jgi:signal transduction histidine kinase